MLTSFNVLCLMFYGDSCLITYAFCVIWCLWLLMSDGVFHGNLLLMFHIWYYFSHFTKFPYWWGFMSDVLIIFNAWSLRDVSYLIIVFCDVLCLSFFSFSLTFNNCFFFIEVWCLVRFTFNNVYVLTFCISWCFMLNLDLCLTTFLWWLTLNVW